VLQGSWQRKDEQAEQDNVYSSETRTEKQDEASAQRAYIHAKRYRHLLGIKKWYARHSI